MHKFSTRKNRQKKLLAAIVAFILVMVCSVATRPTYHAQFEWLFDQESLIAEENRLSDED